MSTYKITKFTRDDLIGKTFNTNNLEKNYDGVVIPYEEYLVKVELTNYLNYIEYYSFPHIVIPLLQEEITYLKTIGKPSLVVDKVTIDWDDFQVQKILSRWNKFIPTSESGYFVRLNRASPKDSVYECRVWSAKDILKTIVSSARCYKSIEKVSDNIRSNEYIILKEWNSKFTHNPQFEFRVFVCNSKVTAISQYHCYTPFDWSGILDEEWNTIYKNINNLYNRCNKFPNCVMDVYVNQLLNNNFNSELVEFNSFGMELASGSALFDWDSDKQILYGKTRPEIRILNL